MKNYIIFLSLFFTAVSFSQSSEESWKLYDDTEVARIYITIDPAAVEWIYNNIESDSLHFASMYFKNKYIDESVDSIGFRLRGNTSRYSDKKSFKISFNTFVDGREFYGVDKLNLNGEHNDPSIARAKLCWDFYKEIGMASSRASFAEVYINNKYYGLYVSVEHIDDEFLKKNFADDSGNLWKCLFPADLTYLGSDPDLYKLKDNNRPVYELSTNEDEDDYSQLARLISIINNTPAASFQDSIEKILDVPEVLQYFAMNVLTGSWDDYRSLRNNYYLYHNPTEDKFHWIPYDYDNTFGIDWFNIDWANANPYNFPKVNSGPRPLAEKLMYFPQYKNLYTHFLEFYNENILKLDNWNLKADSLKDMLSPSAVNDTFRALDYGFTMTDFYNSYSTGYSNQHVKKGIKEFANIRYNSLPGQLSYSNAAPMVYQMEWYPKTPSPTDSIYVIISAFSKAGIEDASVRFIPNGSTNFIDYSLTFSPIPNTKKVEEADRWLGIIPPLGSGNSGSFKIYMKDVNQTSSFFPRGEPIFIKAAAIVEGLVINEFMASNSITIADSGGEYDDWIEIYNSANQDIILSGLYLSDKPDNLTKWQFPGENLSISPGEFLLVWCDEDQEQGDLHTNFKLNNDGEFIGLTAADGTTVLDSISFGFIDTDISFGRLPDASDMWQLFDQPTPGYSNSVTDINDKNILPLDYSLSAFPNPFNPQTNIIFQIPKSGFVSLKIYDILGNEIAGLINEKKEAGNYQIIFDAGSLSSGVYFYRLESENFVQSKKLILLK